MSDDRGDDELATPLKQLSPERARSILGSFFVHPLMEHFTTPNGRSADQMIDTLIHRLSSFDSVDLHNLAYTVIERHRSPYWPSPADLTKYTSHIHDAFELCDRFMRGTELTERERMLVRTAFHEGYQARAAGVDAENIKRMGKYLLANATESSAR